MGAIALTIVVAYDWFERRNRDYIWIIYRYNLIFILVD